ncbi:hypothetical protein J6590_068688 [Homalodisca vitripennis]|nr:hypothetical protein J6590_068688 [Homalodisca vitripennis]
MESGSDDPEHETEETGPELTRSEAFIAAEHPRLPHASGTCDGSEAIPGQSGLYRQSILSTRAIAARFSTAISRSTPAMTVFCGETKSDLRQNTKRMMCSTTEHSQRMVRGTATRTVGPKKRKSESGGAQVGLV